MGSLYNWSGLTRKIRVCDITRASDLFLLLFSFFRFLAPRKGLCMQDIRHTLVIISYVLMVSSPIILYEIHPHSSFSEYNRLSDITSMTKEITPGHSGSVSVEEITAESLTGKTLHVGDNFRVVAEVINNSPYTLFFNNYSSATCNKGSLIVHFTAKKVEGPLACKEPLNRLVPLGNIAPGASSIVRSVYYKAVEAGSVNGTATFYYRIKTNGPFDLYASRPLLFEIH